MTAIPAARYSLFYHNRSSKNAEIKFVIADNFHQERKNWIYPFRAKLKRTWNYKSDNNG